MIFQSWHSLCYRFIHRYVLRAVLFWLFCLPCLSLWAEVPSSGTDLPLFGGEGSYRLDYHDHAWRLSIRSNDSASPIQHDLLDCRFCAAESAGDESDNCQMDGVFSLNFDQQRGVGVVCHVGAHSQRLLLFDLINPDPRKVITGYYYLSLSLGAAGLEVTYDNLDRQGEPNEQRALFATGFTLKRAGQRLLLDAHLRPLRIGPVASAPIAAWLTNESVQIVTDLRTPGWLHVQRRDGTLGYLLAAGLPESIDQER